MFRVLFIKPQPRRGFPQAIDLPLAFLYLSAYLKSYLKENIAIDVIDLRIEKRPVKALTQKVKSFCPNLIGISVLSQDKFFLDNYTDFLKELCPETDIIIGGPGATYDYQELLAKNSNITCAVMGEGEQVLLNIVMALINKEDIKRIKGVACLDKGRLVINERESLIEDLDKLPLPDYALFDLEKYMGFSRLTFNIVLAEKRYLPVMSSRGCPYHCLFCHNMFGKKIRKKNPERFWAELEMLYKQYDIREFHIIDDNFNVDAQHMHAVLNLIIKSNLPIKLSFPNGLRSDLLTKEDIQRLRQAGTYKITVAIDTASPRLQKIIKRNLDIGKALRSIEYAKDAGMFVRGYFMIGFPGESVQEIKATIMCAIHSKLDMAGFLTVVPFKNTGIWELAKRLYPDFDNNEENFYWGKTTFYEKVTGYPLKRAQIFAYLRFYLPFRIVRTVFNMPRKFYGITRWFLWGPQILFPRGVVRRR